MKVTAPGLLVPSRVRTPWHGILVDKALPIESVCQPEYYRAADCVRHAAARSNPDQDEDNAPIWRQRDDDTVACSRRRVGCATVNSTRFFLCKRSKGCQGGNASLTYDSRETRGETLCEMQLIRRLTQTLH